MDEYIYFRRSLIIDELNQFVTLSIQAHRLGWNEGWWLYWFKDYNCINGSAKCFFSFMSTASSENLV